ncbi:MAG: hypothetical protein N4A35_11280 [Flavobacteriales bacterium]|jgi:hypothetical protein|nr:hypothetical protein [Flavobacteriales bacterium]
MKNAIILLSLISLIFISSCKKATLTKKLNDSTWELKKVMQGDEDVTVKILKTQMVYSSIEYAKDGNGVILGTPNREELQAEGGTWTLEKIVPTVGDRYYLIRNSIEYQYGRRNVFNVSEYGSEMKLTENNVLTQTIDDYTITYEKIN